MTKKPYSLMGTNFLDQLAPLGRLPLSFLVCTQTVRHCVQTTAVQSTACTQTNSIRFTDH